jgi:hypothetical protein
VIAAILLSESRQDALGAIGVLTAVAVELILPGWMLVAETIVFTSKVHIHSLVGGHYLGQVIFKLMVLMGVDVTLVTEVGIVVFTELSGLATA